MVPKLSKVRRDRPGGATGIVGGRAGTGILRGREQKYLTAQGAQHGGDVNTEVTSTRGPWAVIQQPTGHRALQHLSRDLGRSIDHTVVSSFLSSVGNGFYD